MKTGRVLWYDSKHGYGVIEDEQGNEFYFDASVFKQKEIKSGNQITFEVNTEIKHVACARNVSLKEGAQ